MHGGNAREGFLKWARRLLVTAVTQLQYAINNAFWTACTAVVPSNQSGLAQLALQAGNADVYVKMD